MNWGLSHVVDGTCSTPISLLLESNKLSMGQYIFEVSRC